MKHKSKQAAIFVLAVYAVFMCVSISCSSGLAPRMEYAPDMPDAPKVVILFETTSFKTELVVGLAKTLKGKGILVITDDIKMAGKYPPGHYDMVVFVASVHAFHVSGVVDDYIRLNPEAANILLASTSGKGNLTGLERNEDLQRVDTITGASSDEKIGAFADKITNYVVVKLKGK